MVRPDAAVGRLARRGLAGAQLRPSGAPRRRSGRDRGVHPCEPGEEGVVPRAWRVPVEWGAGGGAVCRAAAGVAGEGGGVYGGERARGNRAEALRYGGSGHAGTGLKLAAMPATAWVRERTRGNRAEALCYVGRWGVLARRQSSGVLMLAKARRAGSMGVSASSVTQLMLRRSSRADMRCSPRSRSSSTTEWMRRS